ncbi:hypothetical protein CVU76_03470 [Candidatus Dojkabacteria bacterium HGW-Dojkabacteria-1]|uniref:MPN domain-containing protein n=1 Tax=Candidatus Dojkabacteria bacterium HGW-Dojkabacteria-1 TaxID=2013761 RepID=A0A2N2F4H9_9BACT|nr:MAG: hypothetical protein CVU76_03470 [Candidatus Dojkabacteria bacterium HGW-Dojkabacteria-1]
MLPREKLFLKGVDSLSDSELIQLLVGSGIKGSNFQKISKCTLSFVRKSLKDGGDINVKEMVKVRGVGIVTATRIVAGIELGRRVYGIFDSQKVRITQSKDAYEIFKDMENLKKEKVDILCLNSRFEYISRETVAVGSINCANVLPREVLYPAIVNNSSFILIAHNHPSGDSTPSNEDVLFTKRILESLELVGIQLLDHLIIGKNRWDTVNVMG